MAFVFALIMTGMAISGLYHLFVSHEARAKIWAEFLANPITFVFVMTWCGMMLVAFWGVFIPAFGMIRVTLFGEKLHIWSAAAIAAGILSAIAALYAIIKSNLRL